MGEPQRTDWVAWHRPYADPVSSLSRRRRLVQRHVSAWLDALPGSGLPPRVVSACAGDGRDVLEVLAGHPHVASVDVLLVERDERLAAMASSCAREHALDRVRVRVADAGSTDAFADAVPAGLVLFCGVFGNVADEDVRATVQHLSMLCAPGALVLWTRGRAQVGPGGDGADLTSSLRGWFDEAGFAETSFDAPEDATFSVGATRLVVEPAPMAPGTRLFTFLR